MTYGRQLSRRIYEHIRVPSVLSLRNTTLIHPGQCSTFRRYFCFLNEPSTIESISAAFGPDRGRRSRVSPTFGVSRSDVRVRELTLGAQEHASPVAA